MTITHGLARRAMLGSAVLIALTGVTMLGVSPAEAKVTGITCTKLSGSTNTTLGTDKTKLTGCSGNTGGVGNTKGLITDATSRVKWVNGKSTKFSVSYSSGSGCTQTGALTQVELGFVLADTTGSTTVGAEVSATVCVVPSPTSAGVYKISLLPGTKFIISP